MESMGKGMFQAECLRFKLAPTESGTNFHFTFLVQLKGNYLCILKRAASADRDFNISYIPVGFPKYVSTFKI